MINQRLHSTSECRRESTGDCSKSTDTAVLVTVAGWGKDTERLLGQVRVVLNTNNSQYIVVRNAPQKWGVFLYNLNFCTQIVEPFNNIFVAAVDAVNVAQH